MVSYEHMCPQHCIVQHNGTFLPIVDTKMGLPQVRLPVFMDPPYQDTYQ